MAASSPVCGAGIQRSTADAGDMRQQLPRGGGQCAVQLKIMQPDAGRAVEKVEQSPFSQPERAAEADCPWCGDPRSKPVWRQTFPSQFSIQRCEQCGLAYTTPQ